jgi:hypothetical protein
VSLQYHHVEQFEADVLAVIDRAIEHFAVAFPFLPSH